MTINMGGGTGPAAPVLAGPDFLSGGRGYRSLMHGQLASC